MRSLIRPYLLLSRGPALPTAGVQYLGQLRIVKGNGAGTADQLYLCRLTAAGAYEWVQIT